MQLNKKLLSERDICTKYITPALEAAGWNKHTQLLEEVSFTDGKIYVRGKLAARGKGKRADYILYYKPNIPIAIIEGSPADAPFVIAEGNDKGGAQRGVKRGGARDRPLNSWLRKWPILLLGLGGGCHASRFAKNYADSSCAQLKFPTFG